MSVDIEKVKEILDSHHIEYRVIDPNSNIYIDKLKTDLFINISGECRVMCKDIDFDRTFTYHGSLTHALGDIARKVSKHFADLVYYYRGMQESAGAYFHLLCDDRKETFIRQAIDIRSTGICTVFTQTSKYLLGSDSGLVTLELSIPRSVVLNEDDIRRINNE